LLRRIPERGAEVAVSVARRMQSNDVGTPASLALVVAACWLWVLVKRRAPAEFFIAGTLCVLVIYPGFQDRLLVPVYMLAVGNAAEASRDLLRRFVAQRHATVVVALALLALIGVDFKPRWRWERIEKGYRSYERECATIESRVPPTVRLGSGTGWHYNVCLGRPVYGLKHTVFRAGTNDAVEQAIDKYRIETVVLSSRDPVDRSLLQYFQGRYPDLETVGTLTFIHVRNGAGAT